MAEEKLDYVNFRLSDVALKMKENKTKIKPIYLTKQKKTFYLDLGSDYVENLLYSENDCLIMSETKELFSGGVG